MAQAEDEPFDPLKVKTHPFIQAIIDICGEKWDEQLELLEQQGVRLRQGVIFDRKSTTSRPPEDKTT